ncbi:MAG: hypothetical protein KA896_18575, partial [Leptothrix sp. (in: Bacteria)]|nr:hypothetical protein [Leptothrix sp. (in: b-proteobacteria)]
MSQPTSPRRWYRHPLMSLLAVCAVAGLAATGVRAWVQQQRADDLRAVTHAGDIRMISQTTCIY